MWPIGFDEVEFDEAIAWFLGRVPITKDEYNALAETARKKAFTVAGVAQLDVVSDVWRAIDKAVKDGTTLDDFRKDVSAKLTKAWAGSVDDPAWRMETIFRTNVQNAYAAGRFAQATDPDIVDGRPFWLFDSVLDTRTTKVCRDCDGTILPADDKWWSTHLPPLHFNCRSTIITLTQEQAEERGVTTKKPEAKPDEGFGKPPGKDDWAPDPADYAPELWKVHAAKPLPEKPEHTASHWEKAYKDFGVAAKPLAYGRAAEERGLDAPIAEIEKALAKLRHPTLGRALTLLDIAREDGKKPATLRDLIPFARESKGPDGAVESVRVAAAFADHLANVTPLKKLDAKVSYPRDAKKKERAVNQYENARIFFETMVGKAVVMGPAKVRFGVQRGQYKDGVLEASSRSHVIEHEWGHLIEDKNPTLFARAVAFLEQRTKGESERSLRSITGKAFERHEVAKPDAFRNPYVGKTYKRGNGTYYATEVTSMGVEWLASPDAALTLKDDPEHFWFALGQLAGVGL